MDGVTSKPALSLSLRESVLFETLTVEGFGFGYVVFLPEVWGDVITRAF
jgi:hypothetical protein